MKPDTKKISIIITCRSDPTEFDYVHDRFRIRVEEEISRIKKLICMKNNIDITMEKLMRNAIRGFSSGTGNINYIKMQFQRWKTADIITEYITIEEFSHVMKTLCKNSNEISMFDMNDMDENGTVPKQIFYGHIDLE